jgi:DNA-binding XRE family transcriptional regulator
MKKVRMPAVDDYERYFKRALKEPAFRKALAEADEDPFLEAAYRLIALRKELGLTQNQLARKVGVSQQALARLESPNYKGHSLRSLHKIARACGMKLSLSFAKA